MWGGWGDKAPTIRKRSARVGADGHEDFRACSRAVGILCGALTDVEKREGDNRLASSHLEVALVLESHANGRAHGLERVDALVDITAIA